MSTAVADIRKSITVDADPERAFRVFTEAIARWWPLATHSIHAQDAETVVLEARVGGKFYERSKTGEEVVWGEIVECDPPHLLRYTWHPGYAPGTPMTEVEVRFEAAGDGTRVVIAHSGWERLGDDASEKHRGYAEGWEFVLARFAAGASS